MTRNATRPISCGVIKQFDESDKGWGTSWRIYYFRELNGRVESLKDNQNCEWSHFIQFQNWLIVILKSQTEWWDSDQWMNEWMNFMDVQSVTRSPVDYLKWTCRHYHGWFIEERVPWHDSGLMFMGVRVLWIISHFKIMRMMENVSRGQGEKLLFTCLQKGLWNHLEIISKEFLIAQNRRFIDRNTENNWNKQHCFQANNVCRQQNKTGNTNKGNSSISLVKLVETD